MSISKVVVVGAGIGGLATAIRMARRGHKVTVYEQNAKVGGKVHRIEKDGYSWGFGASLFTMPELLDELFNLCAKDPSKYYRYRRIDPICHYFFADGTKLKAWADTEKFATEVQEQTGEAADKIRSHLHRIKTTYEAVKDVFLYHSLHRLETYASITAFRAFSHFPKIGIGNMHRANANAFSDTRIVQLFDRYATYNGSDPYKASATLNVISNLEYNQGAYFLEDGMPMLTHSLYQLARDMGVEFVVSSRVTSIRVENKRATGIEVNGIIVAADIVVSNMDIVYTYHNLMPAQKAPRKYLDQPRSLSGIIFYWGVKRHFSELDLHNIFFSGNYENEFQTLSVGNICDDPTIYVYVSSKMQASHAPPECENWFVHVNAPHDSGQDWDKVSDKLKKVVIERLSRELGADIASNIVTETINHPASIDQKTSSYLGSLYGSSSNKILSAFLRHPNFSRNIDNLYFCGGSVHPGGGVPLCLLSARIIDEIAHE